MTIIDDFTNDRFKILGYPRALELNYDVINYKIC